MDNFRSSFKFSDEESKHFRCAGISMIQSNSGIFLNQDHYVQSIELPDMQIGNNLKCYDILSVEGQTEFRGSVAKVLYIEFQSRPGVCFEAKSLSIKF